MKNCNKYFIPMHNLWIADIMMQLLYKFINNNIIIIIKTKVYATLIF